MGTVAATNGNLIAFLDAACFEEQVYFFYLSGYVFVLQSGTVIVGEGVQIPVFLNTILNIGDKTLFHDNKSIYIY